MGLNFTHDDNSTSLSEEEKEELVLKHISTQAELNEFEQLNIEDSISWVLKKKLSVHDILNEQFLVKVHKKMFSKIWKWAGKYRLTNKNIGIDKNLIRPYIFSLIDDSKYWISTTDLLPSLKEWGS